MSGLDAGSATRAAAAARALDRAGDAVADALRHLGRAADVSWSGPGAAGYRADLDEVTRAVHRAHRQVRRAVAAMEEHAADAEGGLLVGLTAGALPGGRLLDLAGLRPLTNAAVPGEGGAVPWQHGVSPGRGAP